MPFTKKTKASWHLTVLLSSAVCGSYNATKKEWWNKALVGFYVVVIAVEVICILKDLEET